MNIPETDYLLKLLCFHLKSRSGMRNRVCLCDNLKLKGYSLISQYLVFQADTHCSKTFE